MQISNVQPDGRTVHLRFTDTTDGDFAVDVDHDELASRRAALAPHPWTWLHQVHGAKVVDVAAPGDRAAEEADAAVTSCSGAVVAVQTADCVPVLLYGERGVVGAAHAGWRGAVAGVLPQTVALMRSKGCGALTAVVGPAIGPECYEFGEDDLALAAGALGDVVRSETSDGSPALDLVAGVTAQLSSLDVTVRRVGGCTACSGSWNSHRARVDTARQVAAIWIEEAGADVD